MVENITQVSEGEELVQVLVTGEWVMGSGGKAGEGRSYTKIPHDMALLAPLSFPAYPLFPSGLLFSPPLPSFVQER